MTLAPDGVIVHPWHGDMDAIHEYSQRLSHTMRELGADVRYDPGGRSALRDRERLPGWVLLQYNPFRWGRSGFAPRMLRDVLDFSRRRRRRLFVMVHEAWIPMTDPRSTMIGLWQRLQLKAVLRRAEHVMASTEAITAAVGGDAVHLPVASNITALPMTPEEARARLGLSETFCVTLFGRAHPSRALSYASAAIDALSRDGGATNITVQHLGAGAPALPVPPGVRVVRPGALPEDAVSMRLRASHLVLLPFSDGVSTRRGTLMAALAHGRPVLALDAPSSDEILRLRPDALELTRLGDPGSYAERAVSLARSPSRLDGLGCGAQALYDSEFAWPILARRVLETVSRSRYS